MSTINVNKFLDPEEVKNIISLEKYRRRTARLNQVRRLAHQNAADVCAAVKKERTRQAHLLAQKLEGEWRRSKQEMLEVVGREYEQCLQGVGAAHRGVEIEKTLLAEQSGQSIRDRLAALDRGRAAIKLAQSERIGSEKQLEEDRQHRKHVRLVEDERASMLASLPLPPTTIASPSPPSKKQSTANGSGCSPTKPFGPKDPLASVNVQVIAGDGGAGADARCDAVAEEQRLSDLKEQTAAEKQERAKRERQRFLKAKARMEHERDYNLVLQELEELDKYDRLNREKERACFQADEEAPQREQAAAEMLRRMGVPRDSEMTDKFVEPESAADVVSSTITDASGGTDQTSSEEQSTPMVHLLIRPPAPTQTDAVGGRKSVLASDSYARTSDDSPSTVTASTGQVTGGSGTSLTESGWPSSGSDLEPPSSSGYSLPFSTTTLDDDHQSHVILAGLLHGDHSADVESIGSPTESMLAKVAGKQLPDDGWSSDESNGGISDDEMTAGRIQYDDTDHKSPVTTSVSQVGSGYSSSSGGRGAPQPLLHQVTVRRPPTDGGLRHPESKPVEPSSPVFKNVAVVKSRPITNIPAAVVPNSENARSKLLRQLLLSAVRSKNLLPPKDDHTMQPMSRFTDSFERRPMTTARPVPTRLSPAGHGVVTDLSTIVEVDTPDVSRMTVEQRQASDGLSPQDLEQHNVSVASTARRFEHLFEKGERGINDEQNLTFVSTVPSAQSHDGSFIVAAAASGNTTSDFVDDVDGREESTNLFGNSSSVGSWWLESFQRKVDTQPQRLTPTAISGLSEPSGRSGSTSGRFSQAAATPASMVTGTPSCPMSALSTDLGDSTFGRQSRFTVGSLTLPSSSSSSENRNATTGGFRRTNFAVSRVDKVDTPSLSTSGSGAWSHCMTDTPTAISPPSDSDSETPTAVTVLPRADPRPPLHRAYQLPGSGVASDDGSFLDGSQRDLRMISGGGSSCQFPEVSFTDSNLSFMSHETRAGPSADMSGLDSSLTHSTVAEVSRNGSGSESRQRSRSFFGSSGSLASNAASESLLSFLLHEMSAVSGMSALTPLELSLSSSSRSTKSS